MRTLHKTALAAVLFGLGYLAGTTQTDPIQTVNAQGAADAWGVTKIWGSVVYLIGPDGMVLTRGLDETRAELEKRLRIAERWLARL